MRAVPINVNYRYLEAELSYLLDNADAQAVVFHAESRLGSTTSAPTCRSFAPGCAWVPTRAPRADWAVDYEVELAAAARHPAGSAR